MKRAAAFIDGLNLFHALEHQELDGLTLDLVGICRYLAVQRGSLLVDIHYFSSIVSHFGSEFKSKQALYLEKLSDQRVQIHLGEFRSVKSRCPECKSFFWNQTEKQTDVALASEMVLQALVAGLDEIFIFSADSDFLAAVSRIRRHRPGVAITVISTVRYLRPLHGSLVRLGVRTIRLSPELANKFALI